MSRNQPPTTPQTPLSFKTVPGRHRTQKWNKAPTYSYEGDDWGGYDEYDEYGAENPEPPPPVPSQAPYATQQHVRPHGRANSFDRGDETRQFSAPVPTASSTFPVYEEPAQRVQPHFEHPNSTTSGGRASSDVPRSRSRPRDFTNPEQVPPPLVTKASPSPHERFPPRKSSLSGNSYETASAAAEARSIAEAVSAPAPAVDIEKPLPFIRPSDIYKRIPEEMRKQSEEGSRPSLDSLQRQAPPGQPALTPVAEARESRLFMEDGDSQREGAQERTISPSTRDQLPSLQTASSVVESNQQATLGSPEAARDTVARVLNSPVVSITQNNQNSLSSVQNTPALTRPSPGYDPSREILAERQHDIPVDAITGQNTTALQHQPSQGFRSVVHHAFDQTDGSLSRDSSHSTPSRSGVSRSDTNSTGEISPIMSRVPFASVPVTRQQHMDVQVPSIAEESNTTPTGSRPTSAQPGVQHIPRKPSPSGHTRNISSDSTAVPEIERGYRRSLDPPSSGASPARTPAVEKTSGRRLSTPLSAVPATEPEAADVVDRNAEVSGLILQPAKASAGDFSDVRGLDYPFKALPNPGRGRSGTDYSVREADTAETVNASSDKDTISPSIAEAQQTSQKLFLETHASPITPLDPGAPNSAVRTTEAGSRAGSPSKGRVREIADRYHEMHGSSRRNSAISVASSKSSWSQFGDASHPRRQGTGQSHLADPSNIEVDGAPAEPARPELGREESFRPDLPGGWISSAPTPSLESPRAEQAGSDSSAREASLIAPHAAQTTRLEEPIDLSPTTKKYPLREGPGSATSPTAFDTLKSAGAKLGVALTSNVGIGHQTRDFGSAEPAVPVDQPETRSRAPAGEMLAAPPLHRQETDSTDASTSVASSMAPTPLPKDTPKGDHSGGDSSQGYFSTVAPLNVRSRETSPVHSRPRQSLSGVQTFAPARSSTEFESDRLGDEIARSLQPTVHQQPAEDTARVQDALDAPDNSARTEQGRSALAVNEVETHKPGLLTTRFSWEDMPQQHGTLKTHDAMIEPNPRPLSPEIKPEAAYERPRSKALHVVNAESDANSPVVAPAVPEPSINDANDMLSPVPVDAEATAASISPITKSQEHLLAESSSYQAGSPAQSAQDPAPSPPYESESRLPSYYLGGHSMEFPPEKGHMAAPPTIQPAEPPMTADQPKSTGTILPFKQILALKTPDERIQTYNDTRSTFAGMNTGLNNWLTKMVEQHPEHADIVSRPPMLHTSTSGLGNKRGHRGSPSVAKFTNNFRTTSAGAPAANDDPVAPRPMTQGGDGSRVDMDKMQARGKELMKSAGVFGGKASAGAKGLFARGKSKFGSGSVRKPGNEAS